MAVCDTNLALQGVGRLINRPTTTGGKKYDKYFIYIPTEVAKDSQFPFKAGDRLAIQVEPQTNEIKIEKPK
ncbi:MAG: hypothetical protein ACE5KU_06720 [Nitrososphaerales archaeon]